jgi:hypothetical protein
MYVHVYIFEKGKNSVYAHWIILLFIEVIKNT